MQKQVRDRGTANGLGHIRPRCDSVRTFMQKLRVKDTGPEQLVRSALHKRGLRFHKHRRDVSGSPDIVFPSARVAVFIDGCFWHLCPRHAVLPKHNAEWWKTKLQANRARDRNTNRLLRRQNWYPIRIWEHEPVDLAATRIEKIVRVRMLEDLRRNAKQRNCRKDVVKRRQV